MTNAAAALFRLDAPGEGGVSLRAKLMHVWKTTGRVPEALQKAQLPTLALEPFAWWRELDARRPNAGFGISPITWEAMHAWAALRRLVLTPLELRLIAAIDNAFLRARSQKQEPKEPQP